MLTLVAEGREVKPTRPERPKPKLPADDSTVSTRSKDAEAKAEPTIDPFDLRDYDQDYAQCSKALERHKENKGKTFVAVLGQCNDKLAKRLQACGDQHKET